MKTTRRYTAAGSGTALILFGLWCCLGTGSRSHVQAAAGLTPLALFQAGDGPITMRPPNQLSVVGWADRSGNGRDLTRELSGCRLVPDAINGLPAVSFPDGVKRLAVRREDFFSADAATVFLVVREDGLIGYQNHFSLIYGDNTGYQFLSTPENQLVWQAGPAVDGLVVDQPANWKDGWHLVTLQLREGTTSIRVDGQELGFRTGVRPAEEGGGTLYLGKGNGKTTQFTGAIAELVFYGAALDRTELASVEQTLAGKYALPLASWAPVYEPFDYPAGTDLSQGVVEGWRPGTDPPGSALSIAAGNLANLVAPAPSSGHFELVSGSPGTARRRLLLSVRTGTLYASMLLQVPAVDGLGAGGGPPVLGGYPGCPTNCPEVAAIQLYLKAGSGGYQFGLAQQAASPDDVVWDEHRHVESEVVFLVLSYTFPAFGQGGVARLWVSDGEPAWFTTAAPPSPTLTVTTGPGALVVDDVVFYQWDLNDDAAARIRVDDLRLAPNWSEVLPGPEEVRRIRSLSCLCYLVAPRPDPDPLVTSWFTGGSDTVAQVRIQDGGPLRTTWDGQPEAAGVYADIQKIQYSSEHVYVTASGLASHVMGAWYTDLARSKIFPFPPVDQGLTVRFPRKPVRSPFRHDDTGLGAVGFWVNGTAIYNMFDGFFYDRDADADVARPGELGTWNRDAYVGERWAFDPVYFHQGAELRQYHSHVNPISLRVQLGDNLALDSDTGAYTEDPRPRKHSPILGWALDGHPIYGPYGYSIPADPNSGVRLMVPGYVLRDGSFGTSDLREAGRTSLPYWAQVAQGRDTAELDDEADHGPLTNQPADKPLGSDELSFALGRYAEDWDYLGDLPESETQDVLWDLDRSNGRCCVTPEFPEGTYAYFVTIDCDGQPLFPYVTGRQFCGQRLGGELGSSEPIDEDTSLHFWRIHLGRPFSPGTPPGGFEITLSWRGEAKAAYQVEASDDLQTWQPLGGVIEAPDGTVMFKHRPSREADSHLFYRVVPATPRPRETTTRAPAPSGP